MRVIHLIWSLRVGGAETMLVDTVNRQSEEVDVGLIVVNDDIDPDLLGRIHPDVKLYQLCRPVGSRNPLHIFRLCWLLVALRPDVVHAHVESFIRILRFFKFVKVLTVHSTGLTLPPELCLYDKVICISDSVAREVSRQVPGTDAVVIYNGIPLHELERKSQYGCASFRLVQIGRLDHQVKGQDVLIRAIAYVRDSLVVNGIEVDFVGEGPSREYLAALSEELCVSGCCRFLGMKSREQVYRELKSYDLLVQPSRVEGFGLTVVEAMAAGVPVLVSDIEGPMEIIREGSYGYHFSVDDPIACAEKIIQLRDSMVTDGFQRRIDEAATYARENFDMSTTALRYLHLYNSLISAPLQAAG